MEEQDLSVKFEEFMLLRRVDGVEDLTQMKEIAKAAISASFKYRELCKSLLLDDAA